MCGSRDHHPSRDVIVLLCPGLRKMVHAQCRDVSTSIKSPRYTRLPSRHNLRKPWCSSSSRDFINHQGSLTVLLRTSLSPLVCVCVSSITHTHTRHRSCSRTRAYRQGSVCVPSIIHHHNTLGHDQFVMPDTRDRPSPEGWIFGNVSPRYKSTLHMRRAGTRTGIKIRLF